MSCVRPMIKRCFSSGIQLKFFCQKNRGSDFVYFYDSRQKMTTLQYCPKKEGSGLAWRLQMKAVGWPASRKSMQILQNTNEILSARLWDRCPARCPPTTIRCGERLHKYPQSVRGPTCGALLNISYCSCSWDPP